MLKRNQLKRLSLQKLEQLSKCTTNGQLLGLINQSIQQRNELIREKRQQLQKEIQKIRKQTKKTIRQMNQTVKDQLCKKEKIIMDRNSRPTSQDIKNLVDIFAYVQRQNQLIHKNNISIEKVYTLKQQHSQNLSDRSENPEEKFKALDQEYQRLNQQCERQEGILSEKKEQCQKFKSHLDNIENTIEEYRVKYETVESIIRERQRQLDHLVTYFRNRTQKDHDNIEREKKLSHLVQNQLLKSQSLFNANKYKNQQLRIIQIQNGAQRNL